MLLHSNGYEVNGIHNEGIVVFINKYELRRMQLILDEYEDDLRRKLRRLEEEADGEMSDMRRSLYNAQLDMIRVSKNVLTKEWTQ